MSDTTESEDVWGEASENKQMIFVSLLGRYKILMSRSQLPEIKALKAMAWKELKLEYECSTGIVLTHKQLLKKMHNMKNEVRQKAKLDLVVKPLKDWEEGLLELLHNEGCCSPAFCIFCTELEKGGPFEATVDKPSTESSREAITPADIVVKPEPLQDVTDIPTAPEQSSMPVTSLPETEETMGLSMQGLQRLVLLEQLKLIRMQQKQVAQGTSDSM